MQGGNKDVIVNIKDKGNSHPIKFKYVHYTQ